MTKSQLKDKFVLYLDDMSELSDAEVDELFDTKYNMVNSDRPWEGTKAEATGTTSTSVPYISLPSDFLYLTQNNNYTETASELAKNPVIFVGADYAPYKVVSWSDRRQYREQANTAWLDIPNSRLVFAKQPVSALAVEYDYFKIMPALTDSDEPWFPAVYHEIMYHAMCIDDFIIQQSEKAKSYKKEHEDMYRDYLRRMAQWNASLIQL
jgi:hypothetical protein